MNNTNNEDYANAWQEAFNNRDKKGFNRVEEKSCGNFSTPTDKVEKEKRPRNSIRQYAAGALATLLLLSGIELGEKIYRKIEYHHDLKTAKQEIAEAAQESLLDTGIAATTSEGEIVILQSDENEYYKLDLKTPEEAYPYFLVLSPSEFNNLVQTIPYQNGSYYYTGSSQFFGINGYLDQSGAPSSTVFANYMESELVEAYRIGDTNVFLNADADSEGRNR